MLIYIKLLLTAIFWGGTFIAGRYVARDVGPYSASFLRFLIASTFLLFFIRRAEGKFPMVEKRLILPLVLLGMTGIFSYNVCFFKGLKLIEASRASLIIANNPILIAVLSAILFKESMNRIKAAGILLSVTGAMIVVSRGDLLAIFRGGIGIGEIFIFGSVLSWSAFSIIGKTVIAKISPLCSIAYASAIGTLCLLIPALSEGLLQTIGSYSFLDWFGIFYLGYFGTVLGFVWYYEGIRALGPTRASLFINFVPISAIILAYFILKEPLTSSLFAGALFVVTGVYLTNTASLKVKVR